ncbi:hypothetical protein HY948_04825 [Candidatus Gottesmanbacteria bacterium]|nr:hypothetical protein [Candidatus Gottesmanbacteria bacterium]
MQHIKKSDLLLFGIFLLFAFWLMNKSFGYNASGHAFRIARHQLGDFGLHLSLIRSFSWGNNFPAQLPFFPGRPLPYHYGFDLTVGLLERAGIRIDIALNGLSALAFAVALFYIYRLTGILFGRNVTTGILSVLLFIFHSNLTFVDFIKQNSIGPDLIRRFWYLPDYLNKGPFDGSTISLFFTLNVLLNQRHLIVALATSLGVIVYLLPRLMNKRKIPLTALIGTGLLLGMIFWIHTLIFAANLIVIGLLFIYFHQGKRLAALYVAALLVAFPRIADLLQYRDPDLGYKWLNPGFLAPRPLTVAGFFAYWWQNLGIAPFVLAYAIAIAAPKARKLFWSVVPLFVIANVFQLSYRIDHNHTLINYFLIFTNIFIAYAIIEMWRRNVCMKCASLVLVILLTASGVVDMMAVKNDFQFAVPDAPTDAFMQWIKTSTSPNAVFLSREDTLDPVTLAGRRNYFGATYYGEVMGYPISERRRNATRFFEAKSDTDLHDAKSNNIDYIAIPTHPPANFRYIIDRSVFDTNLTVSYRDDRVTVYRL